MAIVDRELSAQQVAQIAEQEDKKARKDATLNLRISSHELNLIKKAAQQAGYSHYQEWVRKQLTNGVRDTLKKTTRP